MQNKSFFKPAVGLAFGAYVWPHVVQSVTKISSSLQNIANNFGAPSNVGGYFATPHLMGVIAASQIYIENLGKHSTLSNVLGKSAIGILCYIPSAVAYGVAQNYLGYSYLNEAGSLVIGACTGAAAIYGANKYVVNYIDKACSLADKYIVESINNTITGVSSAVLAPSR